MVVPSPCTWQPPKVGGFEALIKGLRKKGLCLKKLPSVFGFMRLKFEIWDLYYQQFNHWFPANQLRSREFILSFAGILHLRWIIIKFWGGYGSGWVDQSWSWNLKRWVVMKMSLRKKRLCPKKPPSVLGFMGLKWCSKKKAFFSQGFCNHKGDMDRKTWMMVAVRFPWWKHLKNSTTSTRATATPQSNPQPHPQAMLQ